ncbi:MAG: hypothetical protein HOE90_01970 [Bacteriovoracaceae bacterium]|jgi:ATP-dependent RNA helicase SUPV3L1/SUV3|nr:hypothetical protein [Bacteriovoracaceae bacterium]
MLEKEGLTEFDSLCKTLEQVEIVIQCVTDIQVFLLEEFAKAPYLESLFDRQFVTFKNFIKEEEILKVGVLEDSLFPEKHSLPFFDGEAFSAELVNSYTETFKDWVETSIQLHIESQNVIKVELDVNFKTAQLPCHCVECLADFRTKLREIVYKGSLALYDDAKSEALERLSTSTLGQMSDLVYNAQKEVEKLLHKIRFKMRRGSFNKLQTQLKGKFKNSFYPSSELGLEYKKKIRFNLDNQLSIDGYQSDLVSEEIFDRYFHQLGKNLWRNERFYIAEFDKLIKSVLSFKRTDISANILREYLGQFWLHSEARLMKRHIVYHMGPTNSGKTYHSIQELLASKTGCYLAPLRLLAAELYDTLNAGGAVTKLLTGEEVIETPGATHISSTIEMARLNEKFDCCVIDEIQMITDQQRGWAWTRALVNIQAPEIHVCGDPSVFEMVKKICDLCGDTLEVKNYERMTELLVEKKPITLVDLEKNDALIVFSRRNALKFKSDLEHLNFKVSIVYGRLSPEVRREQARKFDQGETDIIVATDAIAMGMNLPIKRIVFSTLRKYINNAEYVLSNSEIKQIAGRAGRYKRFPTGYVSCLTKEENGITTIGSAIGAELEQKAKVMVGPDLDIFHRVNQALISNNLTVLSLSEFLNLFNTMDFQDPFYCVELKEMIEITEMVETANENYQSLSDAEIFGFSCAPVNLGLVEHVQYFVHILNNFVAAKSIVNEEIDGNSSNIDYLESSIKCVELYQWLSRHFNNKHFEFDIIKLLHNKSLAIEKLNVLLSDKIVRGCSSCGAKLGQGHDYNICEDCFKKRRFARRKPRPYAKAGDGGNQDQRNEGGRSKSSKYKGKRKKRNNKK